MASSLAQHQQYQPPQQPHSQTGPGPEVASGHTPESSGGYSLLTAGPAEKAANLTQYQEPNLAHMSPVKQVQAPQQASGGHSKKALTQKPGLNWPARGKRKPEQNRAHSPVPSPEPREATPEAEEASTYTPRLPLRTPRGYPIMDPSWKRKEPNVTGLRVRYYFHAAATAGTPCIPYGEQTTYRYCEYPIGPRAIKSVLAKMQPEEHFLHMEIFNVYRAALDGMTRGGPSLQPIAFSERNVNIMFEGVNGQLLSWEEAHHRPYLVALERCRKRNTIYLSIYVEGPYAPIPYVLQMARPYSTAEHQSFTHYLSGGNPSISPNLPPSVTYQKMHEK